MRRLLPNLRLGRDPVVGFDQKKNPALTTFVMFFLFLRDFEQAQIVRITRFARDPIGGFDQKKNPALTSFAMVFYIFK